MTWIRGKPVFIISLFVILILFLSVVIILAGQQSSYLKTSSTGGINPDDFLKDCLDNNLELYGNCLDYALVSFEVCIANFPTPTEAYGDENAITWLEWYNMCDEQLQNDKDDCEKANEAEKEECNRITDGLRGTPTPNPTP